MSSEQTIGVSEIGGEFMLSMPGEAERRLEAKELPLTVRRIAIIQPHPMYLPPAAAKYSADRLAACWNAMLGIPDPQAFVAAARAMREYVGDDAGFDCDKAAYKQPPPPDCGCNSCCARRLVATFDLAAPTANKQETAR